MNNELIRLQKNYLQKATNTIMRKIATDILRDVIIKHRQHKLKMFMLNTKRYRL